MMGLLHRCTSHLLNVGFKFGHKVVGCVTKATPAKNRDACARWELHHKTFCQVTTASGAKWTCNGNGEWYLLKPYNVPIETAVAELLEHFGLTLAISAEAAFKQGIIFVPARRLAALYKLGLPLRVEHLQKAYGAKCCQRSEGCLCCPGPKSTQAIRSDSSEPGERTGGVRRALQCIGYDIEDGVIHGCAFFKYQLKAHSSSTGEFQ